MAAALNMRWPISIKHLAAPGRCIGEKRATAEGIAWMPWGRGLGERGCLSWS